MSKSNQRWVDSQPKSVLGMTKSSRPLRKLSPKNSLKVLDLISPKLTWRIRYYVKDGLIYDVEGYGDLFGEPLILMTIEIATGDTIVRSRFPMLIIQHYLDHHEMGEIDQKLCDLYLSVMSRKISKRSLWNQYIANTGHLWLEFGYNWSLFGDVAHGE